MPTEALFSAYRAKPTTSMGVNASTAPGPEGIPGPFDPAASGLTAPMQTPFGALPGYVMLLGFGLVAVVLVKRAKKRKKRKA